MFAEEEDRNRMGFGTFKTKEPRNIQDPSKRMEERVHNIRFEIELDR